MPTKHGQFNLQVMHIELESGQYSVYSLQRA